MKKLFSKVNKSSNMKNKSFIKIKKSINKIKKSFNKTKRFPSKKKGLLFQKNLFKMFQKKMIDQIYILANIQYYKSINIIIYISLYKTLQNR